ITPDIKDWERNPIEVPMRSLAGLDRNDDGLRSLERIIILYEEWIQQKRTEIDDVEVNLKAVAGKHLEDCERCVQRMHDGLRFLKSSPDAMKAFSLANDAVLLQ